MVLVGHCRNRRWCPEKGEFSIRTGPPCGPEGQREFARIADMRLLERGATKLHYTRLADVMWRFLEDRIGIDALDRTTGEIAEDLRLADSVDMETTLRIVEFLEAADLVKFARAEPPAEVARRVPDDGAGIVGDIEIARMAVASLADEGGA